MTGPIEHITGDELDRDDSAARVIADLASSGYAAIATGEDFIVATAPAGATTQIFDVKALRDEYQPRPERKTGHPRFTTASSLAAYVNAHGGDGTTLYGDISTSQIVAVLNGHVDGNDDAGWGDHRATFTARHTPEWVRWTAHDGRFLAQLDFAEHIEAGFTEIIDPVAAEMLEIAQTFRATKGVNFKSDQMLTSGETHLVYEETVTAKAGQQGNFDVPELITLQLAPYEGGVPVEVAARLRFRISDDGKLSVLYRLIRPENVLRAAFTALSESVMQATGRPVLDGTPA